MKKNFLILLLSFLVIDYSAKSQSQYFPSKTDGQFIHISTDPKNLYYEPLDLITIQLKNASGMVVVLDGRGKIYFECPASPEIQIKTGGALGRQSIRLIDQNGKLLDEAFLFTNTKTSIRDDSGRFGKFLNTLYWTMIGDYGETEIWRINGKFYYTFVRWLRDHVHTLKGMKYFYPELKSGIDLYADTQRNDGMIWDNIYPRGGEKDWWNRRFDYGNFIEPVENDKYELKRIPIENDVEYLFLDGLYYTWKATGDTEWMKSHLDQAIKAVRYSTSDPYRWSDKYQLLKRGFTIDTWDFQSAEDAALVDGNDIMRIELGKTRFGIMYGDNTGMAEGCHHLAEMLDYTGRMEEGKRIRQLGIQIQQRIDSLSWNGNFYTHQISEDPGIHRDLGVDQSRQVSLSNAYSLNRELTHEQDVAIINTYQKIRSEMPSSSLGEWYTIFPPFEKGFGENDESKKWQYMNGGVTPIVAGELAHGAFENGYEKYGVNILDRLITLASKTGDYLHCTYAGKMPEIPLRHFTPLNLIAFVNGVYPSKGSSFEGKPIYYRDPQNPAQDICFHDIPFLIPDPTTNKHTSIEITTRPGNLGKFIIPVHQKASSLYLLHGTQHLGLLGMLTINYSDGGDFTEYIDAGKIGFWWDGTEESQPKNQNTKKAWRSDNNFYEAAYLYGINNPYPEKMINNIVLQGMKNDLTWEVIGITLCDYPVFFEPSIISWGIPDNWGSAAVVYALIEGLAGVKDNGIAFEKALLAPRWAASDVQNVTTTVKYEASGGYVSYNYSYETEDNLIKILYTGNADTINLKVMLPENTSAINLNVNGTQVPLSVLKIENSKYVEFTSLATGVYEAIIKLKRDYPTVPK